MYSTHIIIAVLALLFLAAFAVPYRNRPDRRKVTPNPGDANNIVQTPTQTWTASQTGPDQITIEFDVPYTDDWADNLPAIRVYGTWEGALISIDEQLPSPGNTQIVLNLDPGIGINVGFAVVYFEDGPYRYHPVGGGRYSTDPAIFATT